MSSDIALKVENLSKCYQIYDTPQNRLKQFALPRLCRLLGRVPKQYFREFWALNDVSFEVKKGETVGIIGRNGSGKSTLLQIICGTLNPTGGSIQTNGRIAALLELGSGFNPEFTGRENVYMNAQILGLSREETDARFDDIAAFADIGNFLEQPVKTYSSGMYVRLAFAVAANVSPDILIVDEALAVGDIRFQVKCQRKFAEIQNSGKTILLVSHSGSDIARLCSRAIWLDSGRMKKNGEAKKITEEYYAWMVHDTGVKDAPHIAQDTASSGGLSLLPIPATAHITGEGGLIVEGVGLFDNGNRLLRALFGPTHVSLIVKVKASIAVDQPYVGFQVINSKGQAVLGSNNGVLDKNLAPIKEGNTHFYKFDFYFPEIENGEYLLSIGVHDGAIGQLIPQQHILDAYSFQFLSASRFQKQGVMFKLNDCVLNEVSV